jgi:hypothetical protein
LLQVFYSVRSERLLASDVAQQFFAEVNLRAKKFMSDEHFTVDGRLIQAWAAQQPRPQNCAALRLCRKSESKMAGREGIWLAETNRSIAPGEVARAGESGLAVRLQLRRPQPAETAKADRTTTSGRTPGAVCLKAGYGLRDWLPEAVKAASILPKPAFRTDFKSATEEMPKESAPARGISTSS